MKISRYVTFFVGSVLLLSLGTFFLFLKTNASEESEGVRSDSIDTEVLRVVDGDTVHMISTFEGTIEVTVPVRLLGVDAPELEFDDGEHKTQRECYAQESKEALEALLRDKPVSLTPDPLSDDADQYDRLLRYLILPDGTNVNLTLVELGAAQHLSYFPLEMNPVFEAAEERARKAGKGLWGACN